MTAPCTVERVRVDALRPGDLIVGSSRRVVTAPAPSIRRRHVELVIETGGRVQLVTWRAAAHLHVRRTVIPSQRAIGSPEPQVVRGRRRWGRRRKVAAI